MPHTRKTKYLWLLLLAVQPVFAQVDSLVDVFPLAENNRWTYHWYTWYLPKINPVTVDTGVADYTVIRRIVTSDSVRWIIHERRNLRRGFPNSAVEWQSVKDSSLFEIIEKLEGRHQLIRDPADNTWGPCGPLPFFRAYGDFRPPPRIDSGKVYRYAQVNADGEFTLRLKVIAFLQGGSDYAYLFREGRGLEKLMQTWDGASENWVADHELRTVELPGPVPQCVPSSRSLVVTAPLEVPSEQVIFVANPGAGTLVLTASVSNPHFDVVLDQDYVLPNTKTDLHVRCYYEAAMQDTARIILTSNAASSPDTITIVVNAGNAARISFNPASLYIGDDDMGVLGNPKWYPLMISNHGSATLVIDSVISDNSSFSCLHRITTLAAGASGIDTIVFNPQEIKEQTGHLFFYNNTISSPDTFSVRGYALGALPRFSVREVHFASVLPGTVQEQQVTVSNVGNLEMTSGHLVSTNPVFSVIPQDLQLGVGDSTSVQVRFTAPNGESQSGLILAYNHPVPPETLYVSAGAGMSDTTSNKPTAFSLAQNFPNPFNSSTTIRFALPAPAHVVLKDFDILGQDVATITDEDLGQGTYERNFDGSGLASGLYVYRLTAGAYTGSRKMVLVR